MLLVRNCNSVTAGLKTAALLPLCGEVLGALNAAANAKIRPRPNNVLPRIFLFMCRISFTTA